MKFSRLIVQILNIELSNKLVIDRNFLDGLEDFGVFYIFHRSKLNINSIIRNSCYTGYSIKKTYLLLCTVI